MRMLAYHEGETPLVERTAGAFVAHSVSVGGLADSGSRRNTSRRERNRSSVLSVAGSGRRRALVRAGMPARQGRCASLRDRPAAGP